MDIKYPIIYIKNIPVPLTSPITPNPFVALPAKKSKKYIQDISLKLDTYVLHGACGGWYGQVGWISPSNSLLIDLYEENKEGLEKDLKNPSFTPSVVSSFMVSEFLKMIQNSNDIILDELLLIDVKNNTLIKTGKIND